MSIKVLFTLAALLFSVPAFARGGGDRNGSRAQSSHQSSAQRSSPQRSSVHSSRSASHGSSSRVASHRSNRAVGPSHTYNNSYGYSRHGTIAPAHSQHYNDCGHRWQAAHWNGSMWIPGLWINLGH